MNCAHIKLMLIQNGKSANISKLWILLDICSTVSVTNNGNLVTHVRDCKPAEVLMTISNGDSQYYKQLTDLNMFPLNVHHEQDLMANILLFKDVSSIPGTRITMNTEKEKLIVVELNTCEVLKFVKCSYGLYFVDTNSLNHKTKIENVINDYVAVQKVSTKKKIFIANKIEGTDKSRQYQELIFSPGTSTFKSYVSKKLIQNYDISVNDIISITSKR